MKSKSNLRVMPLTLSIASSLIGGYYVYHFILEYKAKKLLLALRPVPFSMIGRRITFNELQLIAKSMKCEAALSLYLPKWLPDGYRLSAIWVKGRNKSEWAFPIILILF